MADVGCAAAEAACAVSVVVRVRPLTPHEAAAGARVAWAVDGDRRIYPVGPHVGWRPLGADNSFSFERVYGPDASSERIYEECVRARVAHVLAGYNATVIAFGQTSSGKTTTIHGDASRRGIISMCVAELLAAAERVAGMAVRVSYVEIYNEAVLDLLSGHGLALFERRDGPGVRLDGVREAPIGTWAEAEALLRAGDERRHVASTARNEQSSRAHTVCRLVVARGASEPEVDADGKVVGGCAPFATELNLVDLAGSERV